MARDSGLPGLSAVLDPDSFAEVVRGAAPGRDIAPGRVTYLKYKPGTSCLVAHRISLDGAPLDVYATAFAATSPRKLEKGRKLASRSSRLGPGGFVVESLGTVVRVFPHDAGLRGLRALVEDPARALAGVAPGVALAAAPLTALRYKPERRFVARLGSDVVVRVHDAEGHAAALRSAAAFRSANALRVARLLGSSADHHVLAVEWIHGRPLDGALREGDTGAAELAGAALAELHAQPCPDLPVRAAEAEAAAVSALARWLATLCPSLRSDARRLARRLCGALLAGRGAPVPLHGDFYAAQVLVTGSCAALLDLDEASRGEAEADLGSFQARLDADVLAGRLATEDAEALADAVVRGYAHGRQRPDPARLSAYRALSLFRLAAFPFRDRAEDWPEKTAALLRRSAEILELAR